MRCILFTLGLSLCWGLQGLMAQEDSRKTSTDIFVNSVWRETFSPFIESSWGYVQPKHFNSKNKLATTGMLEFRFGYSELLNRYSFVQSLEERYFFGGTISQNYNRVDSDPAGTRTSYTRFGAGNRVGYGYRIGRLSLLPYYQAQMTWSKVSFDSSTVLDDADRVILDRYPGSYRFGMGAEGGIKLTLFEQFSVYGGYEYSVIYPRCIFWEWLGSSLIISTAQGVITVFGEDIIDRSPVLGPLMYVVLRNGLSWVYYQGIKKQMNWPFESEVPLTLEAFKLGVSISF